MSIYTGFYCCLFPQKDFQEGLISSKGCLWLTEFSTRCAKLMLLKRVNNISFTQQVGEEIVSSWFFLAYYRSGKV